MSKVTRCDGCEKIYSHGSETWVTVSRKTRRQSAIGAVEFPEEGDACSPECATKIASKWKAVDEAAREAERRYGEDCLRRMEESVDAREAEKRGPLWRASWFWRDKP